MTGRPSPLELAGGIRAAWSGRDDGDLRPYGSGPRGASALERYAAALRGRSAPGPVRWLDQVHGAGVLVVAAGRTGGSGPAEPGDALVSGDAGACLAILTADCASIALGSPDGVFGAVHAGWRGLLAGVVESAVGAMRQLGAGTVVAALGPCIHRECYEFSAPDLDLVAGRYGDAVRAVTPAGAPALDLPAAVGAALERAGAVPVAGVDACTACSGGYFSHRARDERARQALVVWSEAGAG